MAKFDINVTGAQRKDFENTIKNMVDGGVTTDGLINLLKQAGLDKPKSPFSARSLWTKSGI
ncbi:MAG: hypothetical protein IPN36_16950 [Bacteroidetes bacterium]|nr:hypothetical protein [Bacteroidota bacterium]